SSAATGGDDTAAPTCALGRRQQVWSDFCPGDGSVVDFVDPLIGTRGSGNTIPGPMLPHGMVKLSPDSVVESGSIDAYDYDSDAIEGFSHTHLEGPGGSLNGYSHILLQPFSREPSGPVEDYASHFDHGNETAEVGYYAVTLDDPGVRVELTAARHAAIHRYTYEAGRPPRVLLDVGHTRGDSLGGRISIVDSRNIEGFGVYNVHPLLSVALDDAPGVTGQVTVYYAIRLSRPLIDHGMLQGQGSTTSYHDDLDEIEGADSAAWFEVEASEDPVEVRVGLSLVSVEQARAHLDEEVEGRSLEQVREAARQEWGCLLSRVEVEGGSDDDRTRFYTALYHSFMQPTDFRESGGVFTSGSAGRAETGELCADRHFYADDWCMWDTFRTTHPLSTVLQPETVDDRVASMLYAYEQGGWLPKCSWMATGYSRVMTGNHAVPIIADARVKGFADYDEALAWEAVDKAGRQDTEEWLIEPFCGYFNLGTPPEYREGGFVSHDCDRDQSASMTLEYAYDDWATARLAEALGRTDDATAYDARSGNWRNHWDPEVGFMRGRNRDGSWVEPFDPTSGTDFVESTSWIYSFSVPHDVDGLAAAMGGPQAMVDKLDAFFDEGHFDPSNEPGFHTPMLYNRVGAAWRTQERVAALLDGAFSADPGGLPGNDDAGATSAWYALLAMGLYPIAPGDGRYDITTPRFDRVDIHLHPDQGGATFTILAERETDDAIYIQSARLDGEVFDRSSLSHDELLAGGTLELTLGTEPAGWPEE
ncbi:MAG: glycoside hydrolase family 92 protein, partial [Deltaproteobacteria bacterium]